MKRTAPLERSRLARKSKLGRGRPRPKTPITNPARAAFRAAASAQVLCAVTRRGGPWHPHHVIEAQEIKRRGGDEWDPRNALRLSVRAHERHTLAVRRVELKQLRDENVEFAFELMGTAAYVYLGRMYSGFDPRVELALAELEARDAD